MLSADANVATIAEPWVLLPLVYSLKQDGIYAEYSHELSRQALICLLKELPNGKQDYLESLGEAMMNLYSKVSGNDARYFLDKTPRYALISDDVINMFPSGKFIFLWRNPLAVISSMIDTWGEGKWNIYIYKADLFDGLQNLVDTFKRNRETAMAINYERLLQSPENELFRVMKYLELDFHPRLLEEFSKVIFCGPMGDKKGVNEFDHVSTSPIDKWKATINNPLRRMWCRRYLKWIGQDRLRIMGYDLDELLSDLNATNTTWSNIFSDVARLLFGTLYCLLGKPIIKPAKVRLKEWKWVKRYT
jgi:hypothetical protein